MRMPIFAGSTSRPPMAIAICSEISEPAGVAEPLVCARSAQELVERLCRIECPTAFWHGGDVGDLGHDELPACPPPPPFLAWRGGGRCLSGPSAPFLLEVFKAGCSARHRAGHGAN